MKDYDFKTLSPDEFEDLARQLLNKTYNKRYKNEYAEFISTPKGKDSGIDLFSSSISKDFDIVVQVKHYAGSTISDLRRTLLGTKTNSKKSELSKVKKINPRKYIIVTSLKISLADKQKLKKEFYPFISELRDIIDYKVLNNLLEEYPDIEKRFIKLFFTSAEVLRQVIFEGNVGHGEFYETKIASKLKLFVDTGIFQEAEILLRNKKVLIITGEPGSGKTTLAEILVYKFLKLGYQLGYILNDINQADKIWSTEPQIFYYDDFLGQNFYEMEIAQNQERPLYDLIQRISKSTNKLLVLTTRTIIYNHARYNSARIENLYKFCSLVKVDVSSLTLFIKKSIIKNHIHYKNIPFKNKIEFDDIHITQIASHDNFYPRIIDFVTEEISLKYITENNIRLFDYTLFTLDNPIEIWRMCYEKQITEAERIFINTLFSIGNLLEKEKLKLAFDKRIEMEHSNGNSQINNWVSFENCYKSLNEAFILTAFDTEGICYITFINPSVSDFLLSYLQNYKLEVHSILKSAYYIEQYFNRFRNDGRNKFAGHIKISLPISYYENFIKDEIKLDSCIYNSEDSNYYNYLHLYKGLILLMYFKEQINLDEKLSEIISQINFDNIHRIHFINLYYLVNHSYHTNSLRNTISNKWDSIIRLLIKKSNTQLDLDLVYSLFSLYKKPLENFFKDETSITVMQNTIDSFYETEIYDTISFLKSTALSITEVNTNHSMLLKKIKEDYVKNFIPKDNINIEAWNSIDWDAIIKENNFNKTYIEIYGENKEEYLD